jgi:hypothetical protein
VTLGAALAQPLAALAAPRHGRNFPAAKRDLSLGEEMLRELVI